MESYYDNLNKTIDGLLIKQKEKTRNLPHSHHQPFYPRTIHLTNMEIKTEELTLLNSGIKYSTEQPLKSYWTSLTWKEKKP
jgi:hypothetical protein